MDRFDKFTERARKVLQLAQEEAQRFNHNYIGTEHLLLGMIREQQGVAAKVLASLGVELERAREAVEFIIGRGDRTVTGDIGLTPRAKKVIELSVDEARRLGHHYIGTEHLLLGLAREGEGIGAGILESLDVPLDHVRTLVIHVLTNPHATGGVGEPREGVETPERAPAQRSGQRSRERRDRFTERARNVLRLAQEEAQVFNHNYIGTEHLLLGLVTDRGSIGAKVLADLGVELGQIRSAVEDIITRPDRPIPDDIGLTPRGKKVIELSVDEARQLGHHYIGTEHLLLGLVREGEGVAAGVLKSLGVSLDKVRSQVLLITASAPERGRGRPPTDLPGTRVRVLGVEPSKTGRPKTTHLLRLGHEGGADAVRISISSREARAIEETMSALKKTNVGLISTLRFMLEALRGLETGLEFVRLYPVPNAERRVTAAVCISQPQGLRETNASLTSALRLALAAGAPIYAAAALLDAAAQSDEPFSAD